MKARLVVACIMIIIVFSAPIYATKDRWDAHKDQWSPLMLAAYKSNIIEMEKLIMAGAIIDERSPYGYTALEAAIRAQQSVAVKVLLENGAEVSLKDKNEMTPLMTACFFDDIGIVKTLIEYGAKVDNGKNGWTALMSAASQGSLEILKYLIYQKIEINHQRDVDGYTALMLVVHNGNPEKVRVLLQAGADKNIRNQNGETAQDINKKVNFKKILIFNEIEKLLK